MISEILCGGRVMTRVAVVGVGCGSEAGVEEPVLIYAGWLDE
jgi:hypothetical protein